MSSSFFLSTADLAKGTLLEKSDVLSSLQFNESGLIPVITQQYDSKEVLMLAWMNALSLKKTLDTGKMTYWSRSRQSQWVKGETSGHYQLLKEMRIDCDSDSLLCLVDQQGVACHTQRPSCFFLTLSQNDQVIINSEAQKS